MSEKAVSPRPLGVVCEVNGVMGTDCYGFPFEQVYKIIASKVSRLHQNNALLHNARLIKRIVARVYHRRPSRRVFRFGIKDY